MKKTILISALLSCVVMLTGCQTTGDGAGPSGGAVAGQKCSLCNCTGYTPGKIIRGVCSRCGHTGGEHAMPPR